MTTIVTHNLNFHSDDVFAVATLLLALEKEGNKDVEIIRTRNLEIISKADYVIDVGGEYVLSKNHFDHHGIDGAGQRENGVPYASFGLIWKEYGERQSGDNDISNDVDILLVQPIDALDNGVDILNTKYKDVYPYDICNVIDTFLPTWKEEKDFDE